MAGDSVVASGWWSMWSLNELCMHARVMQTAYGGSCWLLHAACLLSGLIADTVDHGVHVLIIAPAPREAGKGMEMLCSYLHDISLIRCSTVHRWHF